MLATSDFSWDLSVKLGASHMRAAECMESRLAFQRRAAMRAATTTFILGRRVGK